MMNIRLWVKNPYPFQDAEVFRKLLYRMHGVLAEFSMLNDVHYIDIDDIAMRKAQEIAISVRSVHLYQALLASRPNSRVHAEGVEVVIRGRRDDPPEWARKAYGWK
jgi:hypothetical protein